MEKEDHKKAKELIKESELKTKILAYKLLYKSIHFKK